MAVRIDSPIRRDFRKTVAGGRPGPWIAVKIDPTERRASEKAFFEGTHRIQSPDATWRTVSPLLAAVGVTRVADLTGLDRIGLPVFQAVRPRSRNLAVHQGKGVTRAAARVSAVMEAIELWHAERLDHLCQICEPLREVRYSNPIRPEQLRWHPGSRLLDAVTVPWIRVRSLHSNRTAWLPRGMLQLDFSAAQSLRPALFMASSNGLASGNCLEEALLHGLCEVVERHRLAISRRDGRLRAAIDPAGVGEGWNRELIRQIEDAGMRFAVFDISGEMRLPTVVAELASPDLPVIWRGSGCHPSRDVAFSRALTEAAQSRLTYIAGARDDLVGLAKGLVPWRDFETYSPEAPRRAFSELPDIATSSVRGDLEAVLEELARRGREAFWVDLSRPEIGVPVVSAFVPGLQEIHG